MELPEVLTADLRPHDDLWPKQLARAAQAGKLVRIRQGCYVKASAWAALTAEHKHRMLIAAVARTAHVEPIFAGPTAGMLWGFPVSRVPEMVDVVFPVGFQRGSANGVRRRAFDPGALVTTRIGEWSVLDKIQTAIDLALNSEFPWAVSAMDRLLNSAPLSGEAGQRLVASADVAARIGQLSSRAKRRKAFKVLDFADGASMSPGESISRANIHILGFPAPELQTSFSDSEGHCATVDFWWKEHGLVGEFDGRAKYLKPEYLNGRTPSQVVIDEKNRENRLRALGLTVVRWEWATALDRTRLQAVLRHAGLVREPKRRQP